MQIDLDTLCMASTAEPIEFFTASVSACHIGKNLLSVGSRTILQIISNLTMTLYYIIFS